MSIAMSSVDLTAEESTAVWQEFGDWLDKSAHNYTHVWAPTVLPGKDWFDVNLNSFGGVITQGGNTMDAFYFGRFLGTILVRFFELAVYIYMYRAEKKSLYVVARNPFLLLLNFSAWPCLGAA